MTKLTLGFVGLLMVVWRKLTLGSPMDHVTPVNMAFAIGALLSITIGTLYQKRFVQPCDVRSANAVQLLAAFAVTVPLALTTGFNFCNAARVVSGRRCSSSLMTNGSPLRCGINTGVISAARIPACCAAAARCWLRSAKAS